MASTAQPESSASGVETLAATAAAASTVTALTEVDAASNVADSGAAAAADAGDREEEEEEEMDEVAVCITVHPPRQSGAGPLVLEPLAGVELVMQVRQLLGEIPQTCLFSAFQLVAVRPKEGGGDGEGGGGGGGGGGEEEDKDVWKREGEVMNDYVELRSIEAVAALPSKVEVRAASNWYPSFVGVMSFVVFLFLFSFYKYIPAYTFGINRLCCVVLLACVPCVLQ